MSIAALESYDKKRWQTAAARVRQRPEVGLFIDDAIEIANDSVYGLAAGIWTRDLDKAHRLIKEIEAGIVWVNCFDEGDMTQPFGGYKQSGNARDKCFESLLSYTQTKSAWIRLSART